MCDFLGKKYCCLKASSSNSWFQLPVPRTNWSQCKWQRFGTLPRFTFVVNKWWENSCLTLRQYYVFSAWVSFIIWLWSLDALNISSWLFKHSSYISKNKHASGIIDTKRRDPPKILYHLILFKSIGRSLQGNVYLSKQLVKKFQYCFLSNWLS